MKSEGDYKRHESGVTKIAFSDPFFCCTEKVAILSKFSCHHSVINKKIPARGFFGGKNFILAFLLSPQRRLGSMVGVYNEYMDKQYYVYILTNKKYGTLYVGVTNDLKRRIYEHKMKLVDGFTKEYDLHLLVYFETTNSIESAILREKQIKAWKRNWKINKIEAANPDWNDLYPSLL